MNKTVSMANAVASVLTSRRYGVPDSKTPQKNPSRNGPVMKCTGCGSDNHFYKKCNNPNKEAFRAKKLKEIAEAKGKTQRSQLRSYFLQVDEASSDDTDSPITAMRTMTMARTSTARLLTHWMGT